MLTKHVRDKLVTPWVIQWILDRMGLIRGIKDLSKNLIDLNKSVISGYTNCAATKHLKQPQERTRPFVLRSLTLQSLKKGLALITGCSRSTTLRKLVIESVQLKYFLKYKEEQGKNVTCVSMVTAAQTKAGCPPAAAMDVIRKKWFTHFGTQLTGYRHCCLTAWRLWVPIPQPFWRLIPLALCFLVVTAAGGGRSLCSVRGCGCFMNNPPTLFSLCTLSALATGTQISSLLSGVTVDAQTDGYYISHVRKIP